MSKSQIKTFLIFLWFHFSSLSICLAKLGGVDSKSEKSTFLCTPGSFSLAHKLFYCDATQFCHTCKMCHNTVCHQAEDNNARWHRVTQNLRPSDVKSPTYDFGNISVGSRLSSGFHGCDVTHLIQLLFHWSPAADKNPPWIHTLLNDFKDQMSSVKTLKPLVLFSASLHLKSLANFALFISPQIPGTDHILRPRRGVAQRVTWYYERRHRHLLLN